MTAPDKHGWRPIESAPKDGRLILLWGHENVIGFWWRGKQFRDSPISEFWSDGPEGGPNGYDCGMSRLYGVTHWQPLPPPPEQPE